MQNIKPEKLKSRLRKMDVDVATLKSPEGGTALFCDTGARLMGLWPDPDGPNLLWTNPLPPRNPQGRGAWTDWDTGGLGGDRLWFGPEFRWFFEGTPQKDLANWRVPGFMDPGNYQIKSDKEKVNFSQNIGLGENSWALIKRTFNLEPVAKEKRLTANEITIRENRHLHLEKPSDKLEMDLWNITQIPAGSWLIVPIKEQPVVRISYEETQGEIINRSVIEKDHFRWKVTGKGNVKASLPASVVRGMAASLQKLDKDKFALVIRRFLPSPQANYHDALFKEQVSEQCIQWWDGFGFGEIEVHSPTLSSTDTEIQEQHYIHAWIGPADVINKICNEWLECNLPEQLFI